MNIRNILVPTDFSKQSNHALDLAIDLAKKNGANVHVLFVAQVGLEILDSPVGIQTESDKYLEKIEEKALAKLGELVTGYGPDNSISAECKTGIFEEVTPKFIEDKNIDLVVMGRTGATGIRRMFMGSNTEQLMQLVKCPVIGVDGQIMSDSINKIIFGFDLSDKADKVADDLKALQSYLNAKLVFLSVQPTSSQAAEEEILDNMKRFVEKHGFTNYETHVHYDSSAAKGLMDFIYENRGDMLAFAKSRKSGLKRFFTKSISEDVLANSLIPIWSMNAE